MTTADLAPIVKTLEISVPPARAFDAFAREMGRWWPLHTHSRADRERGERAVDVGVEARVGGRVFEILDDGRELDWGEVLVWQPGARFEFSWHLGAPPEQATRVRLDFEPGPQGGCRVTLTHSDWARLGEASGARRLGYVGGWDTVFGAGYGGYVGAAR